MDDSMELLTRQISKVIDKVDGLAQFQAVASAEMAHLAKKVDTMENAMTILTKSMAELSSINGKIERLDERAAKMDNFCQNIEARVSSKADTVAVAEVCAEVNLLKARLHDLEEAPRERDAAYVQELRVLVKKVVIGGVAALIGAGVLALLVGWLR